MCESYQTCLTISNNTESIEKKEEDFPSAFTKVFSNNLDKNLEENNEKEVDQKRYFNNDSPQTKENTNTNISTDSAGNINLTPIFFNVKREESKEESANLIGHKRGRKKPENENDINDNGIINNGKKKHDKYDIDNILTKIQVSYINFIIIFINIILDFIDHDKNERFKHIDYKLKQKVNQKDFVKIKSKKLYEIVCMKISPKNKNIDKDYNKNLYLKLKSNSLINNIFNENYIKFFRNVFYKSEKTISLKPYGNNDNITLSNNIKMFVDKLKSFKDKDYIESIKKCVEDNYFEKKIIFNLNK